MTLLLIAFEFLKTGLFAVGGGLATLPFISDIAQKYNWFCAQQLSDMIAISESLPGPLGANVAVFAGFRAGGVPGGLVALLALIMPSVIIVSLAAKAMQRYRENAVVDGVFAYLRPMSVGLIAGAVLPLITMAVTTVAQDSGALTLNAVGAGMFAVLTMLVFLGERHKVHPLVFIGLGAVLGILLGGI
jgi:chromate transporter